MKARSVMFLTLLAGSASAADTAATDREIAMQLGAQLKAALSSALQTSPEEAINVCNERAPQIAATLHDAHEAKVGRTALRVRNPSNEPTDWQRTVLEDFQKRAAAGEPLTSLEFSAVVSVNGQAERRFMKAIGTEPLCLVCHGQRVSPDIKRAIAKKYPRDAATGFKVGDLRGAFYVVRAVD